MTTTVKEKQNVEEKEEEKIKPSDYSCEIILEKTTFDKSKDKKLPSDAFNVRYLCEGSEYLDVTRSGKQSNVFDFYYDKYGKDAIQAIDWGYGAVNPSQFGYKPPQKKKRKG